MSDVASEDAAQIVDLLARYAHVIDNRDLDQAASVFTTDIQFGRNPVFATGFEELATVIAGVPTTHGHNTTDVILDQRADGSVRAWSKFFIVRSDGTIGSGDYQDTLVRTAAGWRIAERAVSRGNRLDTDPSGGASSRSFTFASWLH